MTVFAILCAAVLSVFSAARAADTWGTRSVMLVAWLGRVEAGIETKDQVTPAFKAIAFLWLQGNAWGAVAISAAAGGGYLFAQL